MRTCAKSAAKVQLFFRLCKKKEKKWWFVQFGFIVKVAESPINHLRITYKSPMNNLRITKDLLLKSSVKYS